MVTNWCIEIKSSINNVCSVKIVHIYDARSLGMTVFQFLARQRGFVKDFILTARNQTRMSFDAGDQSMGIAGNGKSGERPESCGHRIRINFHGTLESNDSLWIAYLQQLIGPIASVNSFIVGQTSFTVLLMRFTISTFNVARRAFMTVRINAKGIFTSRSGMSRWIKFPVATFYCPIVIAMIVNGSFSVEQQTIFTGFQC